MPHLQIKKAYSDQYKEKNVFIMLQLFLCLCFFSINSPKPLLVHLGKNKLHSYKCKSPEGDVDCSYLDKLPSCPSVVVEGDRL